MKPEIDESTLTAYALGELDARDRARVAAHVEADADARRHVEATREMAATVAAELGREHVDGLTEIHREVIERRLRETERAARRHAAVAGAPFRRWVPLAASIAASVAIVCATLAYLLPRLYPQAPVAGRGSTESDGQGVVVIDPENAGVPKPALPGDPSTDGIARESIPGEVDSPDAATDDDSEWEPLDDTREVRTPAPKPSPRERVAVRPPPAPKTPETPVLKPAPGAVANSGIGPARSPEAEDVRAGAGGTEKPPVATPPKGRGPKGVNVSPPRDPKLFDKIVKSGTGADPKPTVYENPFRKAAQRPRSWFPVRVDTVAYWAVRANLLERRLPPAHRVRVEELVNRYAYRYAPPPEGGPPLAVSVEVATCPWNVNHRLAHVALKARDGGATVVAKGVETSVEFNPLATKAWRLIGYENTPVPPDQSRTGIPMDLAAGNAATAFYEIVPMPSVDPRAATAKELFTVTVRYRDPLDAAREQQIQQTATDAGNGFDRASEDFRFASAVAAFGMLLRDSHFKGTATYPDVMRWATAGKGADEGGQRAALIDLVRQARDITR